MTDWERCVEFHGHECGGLSIGYRAANYAAKLLKLENYGKGQVVCVAENNTCSVDAIRCLLGCREEWGNLQFDLTDTQAFSFFDRISGESVRLILRPKPDGLNREGYFGYLHEAADEELFEVEEA